MVTINVITMLKSNWVRWALGVTRKDKIRNEYVRGTAKIAKLGDKLRNARLRWYGHVKRREEDYVEKRMEIFTMFSNSMCENFHRCSAVRHLRRSLVTRAATDPVWIDNDYAFVCFGKKSFTPDALPAATLPIYPGLGPASKDTEMCL